MGTEKNKLEGLRDRQPFRVPEGYFEGLTEDIMSRLPEQSVAEPVNISIYDRVKPWLYLAAMFIGIVVFLNVYGKMNQSSTNGKDVVPVTTGLASSSGEATEAREEDEFFDYIKEMYADKYAVSYIDDFMDSW